MSVATTTIRIDCKTHSQLVALGDAAGATLIETLREATEALRRQRFAERVTDELASIRSDRAAWNNYLTEATDSDVTDGLS